MSTIFDDVRVGEGDLAFRAWQPDRVVLGRAMAEWLRPAVAYWHSFCGTGADPFGAATMPWPWFAVADPMQAARMKADAAFAFIERLGVKHFCFHDRDVAREGASLREGSETLRRMEDVLATHMQRTGTKLLWGTANLFSHPRYMAGAATNPDPEMFAAAAAQVRDALEMTHRLGGSGYVLWGGREGYDTLLNTDLAREDAQAGRFLKLVVEHKHRIGFKGTILVEPKPMEPTKHQYDFDVATVYGFLARHGLLDEVRVNVEANHATLAGHSFEHEVATAAALGILGSIDINRGDAQNGWDTDQFPTNAQELAPALLAIVRAGGLGDALSGGGFNFDAKLRRQSIDPADLFHAHIGGLDALARALLIVERVVSDGRIDRARDERYAGWRGPLGARIEGGASLAEIADAGLALDPKPRSGGQEFLENILADLSHPA
jgi:xylose isomerase